MSLVSLQTTPTCYSRRHVSDPRCQDRAYSSAESGRGRACSSVGGKFVRHWPTRPNCPASASSSATCVRIGRIDPTRRPPSERMPTPRLNISTNCRIACRGGALWTQPLSRVELLTRFKTRLQSYIRPASQSSTFRILWRDERNPRGALQCFSRRAAGTSRALSR